MNEKVEDSSQKTHRLKLSIDVKSIKDQEFLGQIFVKYNALPDVSVRPFRNAPTLPISAAKIEYQIPNAFASYLFEATGQNITGKMNQTFEVEVWHSDRLKKDVMLGIARIELNQIMNLALRKTRESYARVFDAYVPVDAVDEQRKPQRKIATLRVIIYLEDLGPVSLLKENEDRFGLKPLDDEPIDYGPNAAEPGNYTNPPQVFPVDDKHQVELNELEYKVVWELETWKKAEEAKTKILLKQKEVEFWGQLAEQQKKQDLDKQKYFKKIQANLNLIEGKLKAKGGELQKREQKIVLLQQQLQTKITEVSRQLLSKDEEIDQLKKKNKEDKLNAAKEKAVLQLQIQRLKNQNTKIRIDFEQASKEDEKSPLFLIKTELNNKYMEIKELSREYEKALETKEQYKVYYEKMRNEVVKLKAELEKKHEGSESLKLENELLKSNNKALQHQMTTLCQQQQPQQYMQPSYPRQAQNQEPQFSSEVDRLRCERQNLLDSGGYSMNDPLIKEYDRLIGNS